MYNQTEYNDNYSKTSESLLQYYMNRLMLVNSETFKSTMTKSWKTLAAGDGKDFAKAVPLKWKEILQ